MVELPEKQVTTAESLPKGKTVSEFFSGLKNRFVTAVESGKKGRNWKEKIILFCAAFFSKIEALSEDEKKVEQETVEKTGDLIMNMPEDQLSQALQKEFLGTAPEPTAPEDKKVLTDFSTTTVSTAKTFSRDEAGKMAVAPDKSPDKISLEEKMLIASFGIRFFLNLRKNPSYDSIDKYASGLDRFEALTKNGKGLSYIKQQKIIKEIFNFPFVDSIKFLPLLDRTDLYVQYGILPKIGSGSVNAAEVQRKLSVAPLSPEEALKLQSSFAKLLPNTSDNDRAKALMTINHIILAGGTPTNRHIAELVFSINPVDLQSLSEILKSIK